MQRCSRTCWACVCNLEETLLVPCDCSCTERASYLLLVITTTRQSYLLASGSVKHTKGCWGPIKSTENGACCLECASRFFSPRVCGNAAHNTLTTILPAASLEKDPPKGSYQVYLLIARHPSQPHSPTHVTPVKRPRQKDIKFPPTASLPTSLRKTPGKSLDSEQSDYNGPGEDWDGYGTRWSETEWD